MKTIMKRAWELYRQGGCTTRAEFGVALKMAWAESKAPKKSLVDTLVEMGARRWTKGGHDRLYLGKAAEKLIGLHYACYNTGNVCSARLGGESISNSYCSKLIVALDGIYYDITGQRVVSYDCHPDAKWVQAAVLREIKALAA